MNKADHPFTPFRLDLGTCDICGNRAGWHEDYDPKGMAPYREAIWRVVLKHGARQRDVYYGAGAWYSGRESEYGLNRPAASEEEAAHILACGIDWSARNTTEIHEGTYREFQGTFAPDGPAGDRPALVGSVKCKCGEVTWSDWALTDKTLGELIWLAVHEGEQP